MTEPSASIEDLLGHEEEPASRARRQRGGTAWWVWTVLGAAALTAVTIFGLRLFGIGVSGLAVFVGYLALLMLRRISGQLLVAAARPVPPVRRRGPARRRVQLERPGRVGEFSQPLGAEARPGRGGNRTGSAGPCSR